MRLKFALLPILSFLSISLFAFQVDKKEIYAIHSITSIKVNGILDESIWSEAKSAKNFHMFEPDNGNPEPSTHRTEVKVLYDNNAIYIGAVLFDNNSKSIRKEYSQRDNIYVEADVFTVAINSFDDGINENKFYVTAAGTQADSKTLQGGRHSNDFNWSAVWESEVKITDEGLIIEIKIPFSALRFENTNEQTWGINFIRDIKSRNEIYSWNLIDRTIGRESQYNGILHGINKIKPPLRLSFFPFISGFSDNFQGESRTNASAGLDLKLGISESFTIDATIIPDFSQTEFDPVSLNLGPFEQTFREQRQFFTEGLELFEKGNLFYSRRIGGFPNYDLEIGDDDEFEGETQESKVLNVSKISGRTKSGLGIGFLNAITASNEISIKNVLDNSVRKEEINPLTNYNILVVDQQFNDNSSVSLINTNVIREGRFRDANVTALAYDLSTKSNNYNLSGNFRFSTIRDLTNTDGISGNIEFRKTAGKFRYKVEYNMADDKFDNNDLGRMRRNNYSNFSTEISYQQFTPKGRLNSLEIEFESELAYLYKPNVLTDTRFSLSTFFFTQKQLSYNFGIYLSPTKNHDYFEPRTEGRHFTKNGNIFFNSDFSTNDGKNLFSEFTFRFNKRFKDDESGYSFVISPQLRVSDRFKINYSVEAMFSEHQPGYVTHISNDITFGCRDVKEVENSLRFTYNHNTKHAISLNFRYYWSTVNYEDTFYLLEENGSLSISNQVLDFSPNTNFNIWNLDLNYSWQFAPGSQAVIMYRNSIFQDTDDAALNYLSSLKDLLKQPFRHIFSVKITYYIDYLKLKKAFKTIKNIS
jgi:hypothetical protein